MFRLNLYFFIFIKTQNWRETVETQFRGRGVGCQIFNMSVIWNRKTYEISMESKKETIDETENKMNLQVFSAGTNKR